MERTELLNAVDELIDRAEETPHLHEIIKEDVIDFLHDIAGFLEDRLL